MTNKQSLNQIITNSIDYTLKMIEINNQEFCFLNESLINSLLYRNICTKLLDEHDESIIFRICKEFPLYYFEEDKKTAMKYIYDEQHDLYINSDLRKTVGKLSLFEKKDKGNTGKAGLYDLVILNESKTKINHAIEIKLIKPYNELHHGYEDLFLLSDLLTRKRFFPDAKGYMCMIAQYLPNSNNRESMRWKEKYLERVNKAYKDRKPKVYFNHILIPKRSL